jgi:hypothetical protein
MNWVCTICDKNLEKYFYMMVDSLFKYNECKVIFNHNGEFKKRDNILYFNIPNKEWNNRIQTCKIEKVKKESKRFKEGDNVYILDVDMLIKADIFKIFDRKDFDVFYTSRHYKYHFPANAGVCGFRWNKRSKKWLDFYVEQIYKPTWPPLVRFRKKWKRDGHPKRWWWVDQDFLCAMYNTKGEMPFECKVKDLGPKYNYCPSAPDKISIEQADKEMWEKLKDDEYKILHFKGKMKKTMENIYKEMM